MKKLIIIFLLLISAYSFAQDRTMNKAKVKDTLFVYKGIWFGVDSSYMDVAGGTASDTTYWNYPTYDGHKMINARQSKQVNADSGFASSGYIWLKAPTNKNKGSYYIGSGTPGIGATSSGNNIFGYNAGALTYSGGYNNIIGYQAGAMLYDGYQNTFIGANSGYTSSSAYKNVFIGHNSGYFNTTGAFNTFLGWQAGYSNTTGLRNLYIGYMAGNYMTTESNRIILNTIDRTTKAKDTVFSPVYIYETSDTATSNIWINGNLNVRGNFTVHGAALTGVAGDTATIYASKIFVSGKYATLRDLTWQLVSPGSGYIVPKNSKSIIADSLFRGDSLRVALFNDASDNTFIGRSSGVKNDGGGSNVFVGFWTGKNNTSGSSNIFIGGSAGSTNISGNHNVYVGDVSGGSNISGENNTFIGYGSGGLSIGSNNIFIGNLGGYELTTESSKLIISSLSHTGKQADTINSIIFGHQDLVSLNQRLYFNSNVYVKHYLLAYSDITSAIDTVVTKNDTTPSNGLATKLWTNNKFATISNLALKINISDTASLILGKTRASQIYSTIADRIAGDKWGLVAPGSGYINVLNSKKIIATTFYTADSLDVLNVSTSNLFVGQGGKRTLTGTNNIVIGNSAAGDALGSGSYNIAIGSEAGSALLNGSYNVCLGQFSGNASTGSFNLFLGYAAGRYLTTENNRIIIDNRNRVSKANDTIQAPIYVYTAAATANQIIYLNGNVRITDNLRVNGQFNYGTDAQISDDYVVTIPGITSYVTGQVIIFSANTLNTGACTINVNGLGAKSLKSLHDQDPQDSYIEAGSIITAIYDGTNFQIQTPDANP